MQHNQEHITNQNIAYYDKIAGEYDMILNDIKSNSVRKKVAGKMISLVNEGTVLDFGGGTGEDLNWLLKNNYSVIFCEPSSGMRNIAVAKSENFPNAKITFLKETQTDFTTWNESLPFDKKVNGVIANFAVLNCILDIELFFKNLALVTAQNAKVVLLVLDYDLKGKLRLSGIETIKSILQNKPMHIKIDADGEKQLVYLHSIKSIEKAADDFDFIGFERLKGEGFSLIHLRRK